MSDHRPMPKGSRFPCLQLGGLRKPLLIGVAMFAAAVAAGCRDHMRLDDFTAAELNKPEVRHPISYRPQGEALLVELGGKGEGLSREQEADIWRFLKKYRSEATGPVTVSSPRSAGAHIASSRMLRDIMQTIRGFGIPERGIRTARHSDYESDFGPSVKLSYVRPVAVAPTCGDWPEDLGRDKERIRWQNFGCTAQRNLALTVANSRDLKHPQGVSPRSGERRYVNWQDYVGKPQTGGASSNAAQGGGNPSLPAPAPGPGLQ